MSVFTKEAAGFDHLFYIYGDEPFLDPGLAGKMYGQHISRFAEYTFADGYPYGLAPEIVKCSVLKEWSKLVQGSSRPIKRDSLFQIVQKDINNFDLETEISPVDLRYLRLERNFLQLERFYNAGITSAEDFLEYLPANQKDLRALPSYYQLQITDTCPQNCGYCPFPENGKNKTESPRNLALSDLEILLDKIERFSDDAVVSLSVWGEPFSHPEIVEAAGRVLARENLSLVLETCGIGIPEDFFSLEIDQDRFTLIFSIDAVDPLLYRSLRGAGLPEALASFEKAYSLWPGSVYIQSVRMKDNEDHLETFFRQWKEKTDHIIVQKYNNFCGRLPDRKVTDISPLKRFPCWALKREMTILLNGDVPLCRCDIAKENILGNLLKENPADIWQRGEEFYLSHLKNEYPGLCGRCDEFYVYNF